MLATASEFIGALLLRLSKFFMTGTVDEKEDAPLLVDVACQTDDLMAVTQYWHPARKQYDVSRSSLTDMSEVSDTSIEEMDWSAIDDSDQSETDQGNDSLLKLKSYICLCGSCPYYIEIASDVSRILNATIQEKTSTTRLLQAFTTYDEAAGYCIHMISAARECLQRWRGDEDKAFNTFVALYDERCKCDFNLIDTVCTRCDRIVPSLIAGGTVC